MFDFYKVIVIGTAEVTLIVQFIKWFRKREKERERPIYIKKPMHKKAIYKTKSYREKISS